MRHLVVLTTADRAPEGFDYLVFNPLSVFALYIVSRRPPHTILFLCCVSCRSAGGCLVNLAAHTAAQDDYYYQYYVFIFSFPVGLPTLSLSPPAHSRGRSGYQVPHTAAQKSFFWFCIFLNAPLFPRRWSCCDSYRGIHSWSILKKKTSPPRPSLEAQR